MDPTFRVNHANTVFHPTKPYSLYNVTTQIQHKTFQAKRRFKEFRTLHDTLKQHLPKLPAIFPLWPNILNRFEPKVIQQRQTAFEQYLQQVVQALDDKPMPSDLCTFLNIPPPFTSSPARRRSSYSTSPKFTAEPVDGGDTVILVAYQLPLKLSRKDGGGWNVEWDEESVLHREALALESRCLWVGCVGISVEPEEEDDLYSLLLEEYNCAAVFLDANLANDFYHGFCRSYLRPIFHNQLRLAGADNPFNDLHWRAYCNANRKFSDVVMDIYEPGHLVWVHDYHLLLLPSYILRRHRSAHVGLFLHSPFPASDVFRSIGVREELLRAMLNADLIGFLLFEYTRNFLACCKRLLGLEHEYKQGGFLGVEYGGRHIMVQVSTFGVSPILLKRHMLPPLSTAAQAELEPMRRALEVSEQNGCSSSKTIIAGVDYLDRFKGVALKLLAWEGLLQDYPKYRNGYVFVQIILSSRNQTKFVADAADVGVGISAIVNRINGKYPGVVHLEMKENFSLAARLLLWLKTNVYVNAAIREGVNAHPLEYLFARNLGGVPAGVTIMSEFSGYSRVMNGALTTNPFSQSQLQQALDQALTMSPAEADARGRKDLRCLESSTAEEWARRFLSDLKSMERKQEDHWMALGFGLASFRMVGMGANFKALDTQQTLSAYRQCSRHMILLDWGGTLAPAETGFYDEREAGRAEASEPVLEVLKKLCADPSNHVMILSGLGRDKVEAAFGAVPNISLACEHGFHYRIQNGQWQQLKPGLDTSWREMAESIMSVFATRTSGSYVQRKGSSITWNHSSADPEFGALQARELQYQLQGVLDPFPIVVRCGKGYVEVCPKDIDKGVMARKFVETVMSSDTPSARKGDANYSDDFILCVGDDSSDEFMFTTLRKKFGQKPTNVQLFTATVGRKPSEAESYLGDYLDVIELLNMISSMKSNKNKRFASTGDLTKVGLFGDGPAPSTSSSNDWNRSRLRMPAKGRLSPQYED